MVSRLPMRIAVLLCAQAWAHPALAQSPPAPPDWPVVPSPPVTVVPPPAPAPTPTAAPAPPAQAPLAPAAQPMPQPSRTAAPAAVYMATPPAPPGRDAKLPLQTVGTVVAGLGMATWLAAGITWLVAASEANALESECPGRVCVEGTPGGDSYVTARDAAKATDILVGVAAPVLGTGGILLLFSAAIGPRGPAAEARAKVLTAGSTPGSIAVHF